MLIWIGFLSPVCLRLSPLPSFFVIFRIMKGLSQNGLLKPF